MKIRFFKKIFVISLLFIIPSGFIFASEITGFLGQGEQGLQAQVGQLSAEVGTLPSRGGGGAGGISSIAQQPTLIIGDLNGDGKVNKYDFALMMADWGKIGTNIRSDLNKDGKVDKYDFAILMSKWSFA
ncbi:MAG: dockerin type I domain-containing protein [Candidatus Aenigmatarchaeota archaeon]